VSALGETLDVTLLVARALATAGVEYLVGGSVASGLLGEPPATADVDFAVRLSANQVDDLVAALGPDFEVDTEMLQEAIARGRSANIYHLPTVTKVDLFVRGGAAFDRSEFARKVELALAPGQKLFVSAAEDNLLRKLWWFREGGEVSELQWRDVLGMLRVGRGRLDEVYLTEWSRKLGVDDLLDRARGQLPNPPP
jgi:hypothetical protein